MEKLSVLEILDAVKGQLLSGDENICVSGVSIDSRTVETGELFFALKGENTDGHQYVVSAIDAGAAGVVVSDDVCIPEGCSAAVIKVDDVLWAFGDLAAYYRRKFDVKVIGITGSVGKTSTKEMLASILERKWKVLKNAMNYNNEIGVPLTIFRMDSSHEVLILEMAMRGLGEIRRLASIAKPDIGVITNIGVSHIERLGSQSAIAEAKCELLDELPTDGIAILNAEDGYFPVVCKRYTGKIVSFGSSEDADVIGTRIKVSNNGRCDFVVLIEGGAIDVKLPVPGSHNVYNALAAAAVSVAMGVDLFTVRDGLESFDLPAMRMELVESKGGYGILNDAYNANPASMSAALRTLHALKDRNRKIAVLGDMLELGDYGPKAHKDIGSMVSGYGIDMLATVGELARKIADGARDKGFPEDSIRSYSSSAEAGIDLKNLVAKGDVVLVKGSRGMKMEQIVRSLLDG